MDEERVPEIGPQDALTAANAGALLLDVREDGEWQAGHAPDAVHLPMGQLPARADELPNDRRIVAVCRSGGRSAAVTKALVNAGFDAVNLVGGMQAWQASGQPVVTDDGSPGTVA